jgi:hypothetical protein
MFEEAFWLCGAHAGLRLPGEALGLRWGAVDFKTGVMRPYDNWVRNEMDTTKTSDSEAIPMTPRLAHIRTVQALMRHDRLSTTEQYMAYSPRPDLAEQIARALDPHSLHANVVPMRTSPPDAGAKFFERLEDEIPAKWLREIQRLYAEM